jgi:hypothetical protein
MTSFNLNQWDEWLRKVQEIWLLKLPEGNSPKIIDPHWFKLNDVMRELNYQDGRRQVNNDYSPCGNFSNHISGTSLNHLSEW